MKKIIFILGIFIALGMNSSAMARGITSLEDELKQAEIWAKEYQEKLDMDDVAGAMAVLEKHPTLIVGITDYGLDVMREKCLNNDQAEACLKPLEWKREYTPNFELDPVCMTRFDLALRANKDETDSDKKARFQSIIDDSIECVSDENMKQLMIIRQMYYKGDCPDKEPLDLSDNFKQYVMDSPWTHEQSDVGSCLMLNDEWADPKTYKNNLRLATELFDSALKVNPESLKLLMLSGKSHYLLDDWGSAKTRFAKIVKIDPTNAIANHSLADLIILQENQPSEDDWFMALYYYEMAEKYYDPIYIESKIVKCNVMAIEARLDYNPPDYATISACYAELNDAIPETISVTEFNSVNIEFEKVYQEVKSMAQDDLSNKEMIHDLLIKLPRNNLRFTQLLLKRNLLAMKYGSMPEYGIYTSSGGGSKFVLVIVDYNHDDSKKPPKKTRINSTPVL